MIHLYTSFNSQINGNEHVSDEQNYNYNNPK